MRLFDTYVQQATALLRPALGGNDLRPDGRETMPDGGNMRLDGENIPPEEDVQLDGENIPTEEDMRLKGRDRSLAGGNIQLEGPLWPAADRNPFIMERDTAAELGGYPKESINLILSTSARLPVEGVHLIGMTGKANSGRTGGMHGDRTGGQIIPAGHQSFGKIVFLQTEEIPEDEIYDFQQRVQLADLRLQLRDVMVRSSSRQYLLNLRVGKKAIADGFDLEILARTIYAHFRNIPRVKDAAVVLISGDSSLYRQLMPAAERVREITAALNTMFEGIEMDCGSCSMSPVCDEVEDLRRLHQKKAAGKNG
ncbi:MAG: hypothetical protein ACI4LJ_00735 [Anaerovoracaceae bacterium]